MEALHESETRARRVVLVDGNSACHATATGVLSGTEWELVRVEDALDGLCAVVEEGAQAVLLDEGCAPLDPWQFCQLVKHHPRYRTVRIIVLCRRVDVVLRARARAVGVDALLQKPFASDEVLALLNAAPGVAA
jgi:twitching motility two-component system response regulator PilG